MRCLAHDHGYRSIAFYRLVPEGTKRGYNVLVYEGPGQGSVLRQQKLIFTHEWERPNSAVLDYFVQRYGKPEKIVLFGESLGAVLAMRAAARDARIDGVVAFGVLYDSLEISRLQTPWIVGWLYDHGYRTLLNFALRQAGNVDPMIDWGLSHATWTMGLHDEAGALDAMKNYHLRDVLADIRCDVLLMSGTADQQRPMTDFTAKKEAIRHRLVRARYPRKSQADFAAAPDHNPLVLEDCPACRGTGRSCTQNAGEALLDACPECVGEGITGKVVHAFSPELATRRTATAHDGWVKCPWCNVAFAIRDRHRWTGLRHLTCGNMIELLTEVST